MKYLLSKLVLASCLMLGVSAVYPSLAADTAAGPAKPDAAKGATLYEQGEAARRVVACV